MATLQRRYASNAPGTFYVDDTCIDCDLCRQIAPGTYSEDSGHSIVHRQPVHNADVHRAAMALVACPTASIGTHQKLDMNAASDAFPDRIDDNVYFCGYASRNSYGAASYLIVRPGRPGHPGGNVLVDSPRFAAPLVRRIEALGGVSTMFLTHQDDIADHEQFHKHFGCRRIIHRADARHVNAELLLDGEAPVQLDDDLLAIPTPGHTRGHVVLLDREKYLFTGDHLAWSDEREALVAFRNVSWYSWPEQTESMRRLVDYRFEWILPGHGRRAHLPAETMRQKLKDCVEWMSS